MFSQHIVADDVSAALMKGCLTISVAEHVGGVNWTKKH